ncbi:MAG: serine/threonine protein kinase [Balneolaceae bacterium]|nr:serine/threonine protein kinase [Balneolaceae bacterium]
MIGRKIRNYQIEELLGEGGMGVVYRARDMSLGRMVALKMLHPEMLHQPDLLIRFRNEAHVTARLSHPNIATLYSFFSEDDLHCLVMEFVNGKTLEQILSVHKKMPETEVIRVLIQLLEGLEEAHQNEILHRDIKSGNIMINQSGYVKLMDFGVARFESSARITRMNRVIGTLEYMAPELLTGGKPTVQADLYAVGVVAFEMLTGSLPFTADADTDLTEKILKGSYKFPASEFSAGLKSRNRAGPVIKKLMQKNPSRRYKNTGEVLDDLNAIGVSGRVSVQLLSKEKLPVSEDATKEAGFSHFNSRAIAIVTTLTSWYSKVKPNVYDFFKTTEGKIIGGAIGLAFLIMLGAAIFSGTSENPKGQAEEHLRVEEDAVEMAQFPPSRELSVYSAPVNGEQRNQPSQSGASIVSPLSAPVVVRSQQQDQEFIQQDEADVTVSRETEDRSQPEPESAEREEGDVQSVDDEIEYSPDLPEESTEAENVTPALRTVEVGVANLFVEGIFDETVSTLTHNPGDQFYLTVAGAVYSGGYRVIDPGSRIKGRVKDVRSRGSSRRATLAVQFEAVEAVDGTWLPITYPEYSDQATGTVTFEKGRAVRRLRVESGRVSIVVE